VTICSPISISKKSLVGVQRLICSPKPCQKNRNEEVGRSVPFVTEVRPRDKMSVGVMGVMEVVVVAKKLTAHWMVGDLIMYQRLPK
jgi:hypothetical protein